MEKGDKLRGVGGVGLADPRVDYDVGLGPDQEGDRPRFDRPEARRPRSYRTLPGEKKRSIYVDVFNSKAKNATKAHVESESFPLSPTGAREPTDFLAGYGFDVTVSVPRK